MKLLILFFIFLVIGGLVITANHNLALYTPENVSIFSEKYILWLDAIYLKIQTVVGDLFGENWLPDNI